MMKKIILFVVLMAFSLKGLTQNNLIFKGGNGDGWAINTFQLTANNIFNGGDGDGWTSSIYQQTANNIYIGGNGDGWGSHNSLVYNLDLLGITENSFGNLLKAYPNPTTGQINIDLGAVYGEIDIQIHHVSGQLIYQKSYANIGMVAVEVEGARGIYFIQLKSEKKMATIKLVKK